jgi:hypothetical protein
MKMRGFEKRFVNSPEHSDQVAREAERRVRDLDPKPGARLLLVGRAPFSGAMTPPVRLSAHQSSHPESQRR